MSKINRRIEITVFRRQRPAATSPASEPSAQPSTSVADGSLVEEIADLIDRLTGNSRSGVRVRQAFNRAEEDSEGEIQ